VNEPRLTVAKIKELAVQHGFECGDDEYLFTENDLIEFVKVCIDESGGLPVDDPFEDEV
jgi:hypothetical protein